MIAYYNYIFLKAGNWIWWRYGVGIKNILQLVIENKSEEVKTLYKSGLLIILVGPDYSLRLRQELLLS